MAFAIPSCILPHLRSHLWLFLYSLVELVVISNHLGRSILLNPLAAVLLHLFYSFDLKVSIRSLGTEYQCPCAMDLL